MCDFIYNWWVIWWEWEKTPIYTKIQKAKIKEKIPRLVALPSPRLQKWRSTVFWGPKTPKKSWTYPRWDLMGECLCSMWIGPLYYDGLAQHIYMRGVYSSTYSRQIGSPLTCWLRADQYSTISLGKLWTLLSYPAISSARLFLAFNNPWRLIYHKRRTPPINTLKNFLYQWLSLNLITCVWVVPKIYSGQLIILCRMNLAPSSSMTWGSCSLRRVPS